MIFDLDGDLGGLALERGAQLTGAARQVVVIAAPTDMQHMVGVTGLAKDDPSGTSEGVSEQAGLAVFIG